MSLRATDELTSEKPLYEQVLSLFTTNIRGGTWPVGTRLKDEIALAEELGVSRGTLRRAVSEMARRGVVRRLRGRGTFVLTNRIEQPLATRLISFAEAMDEQGLAFTTAVFACEARLPGARERALLEMRRGEKAFVVERVRSVGGAPVVYLRNHVPVKVCPGLSRRALVSTPLFQLIEKSGHRIEWGRRSFRAVAAGGSAARRLRVPAGSPLLLLEQTVYSTRSLALECSSVWIDSSRMEIAAVLSR
jgi:DNA-binding GntR family transcriptional regulator